MERNYVKYILLCFMIFNICMVLMMTMGNTHEELPQQSSSPTVMLQYNSKFSSPLSYLEAVSHELWNVVQNKNIHFSK